MKVSLLVWLAFFIAGFAAAVAAGDRPAEAVWFGASLLVWGGPVRTVLVWHITWSVNSVTHVWGYQNYATGDDSRNNLIIGLLLCRRRMA